MPVANPPHGSPCQRCGSKTSTTLTFGETGSCCSDFVGCDQRVAQLPKPFDPNPRVLEPAQNGFHWCRGCESVQPVTGHECRSQPFGTLTGRATAADWEWLARASLTRLEFAESLLCAMAFDHARALYGIYVDCADDPHAALMLVCGDPGCVFCDAARGGGR